MRTEQLSLPGIPAPPAPEPAEPVDEALERRKTMRARGRGRWESMSRRMVDHAMGDDLSEMTTPFDHRGGSTVPDEVTFHGSRRSSWYAHATPAEVPLHSLSTVQDRVSRGRVEELVEDPGKGSVGRIPGRQDVPRVYRNTYGRDIIMDGNHRATANYVRGEMFVPALVATDDDIPAMRATNARLDAAEQRALEDKDQGWVAERLMNLHDYGEADPYGDFDKPRARHQPHPVFEQLHKLLDGSLPSLPFSS